MPLSDRENQILQDIEKQLSEQDPKLADRVGGHSLREESVQKVKQGIAIFVAGFGLLIAFFVTVQMVLGVLAFLVMVAGATHTFQNLKRLLADQKVQADSSEVSLLSRVEHRIRDMRRRDEAD
ncbi:MAG: DUF3040 domain-containing protein [Actinomycetota bacterium]